MTPDVSWHGLSIDAPGPPPSELDRTGAVALIPAGDRAFASAAALTLARSLARAGRRVFLCDLDLPAPRLHIMAGVPRDAGVTDFVLYGASAAHVVTELEERLLFVSAGTPVVSFDAVYSSDRWEALLAAATHARACLLLMVPPDVRGVSAILDRAETLVALGNQDECPDLGEHASRLRIGFHPRGPVEPPRAPRDAAPPVEDDVWSPDPAAVGPDPDDESTMSLATATAVNRTYRRASDSEGGRGRWWILLLLLLAAVAVAGWMGWISIPGVLPRRADQSEPVVREAAVDPSASAEEPLSGLAPAAAPAEPTPTNAPIQGWALRLGAFQSGEVARREAARYSAAAPGHVFAVVPVDVNGTLWFRVISAVAADEAEAEIERSALSTALAEAAGVSGSWIAQAAPLAYLVAEAETLPESRARVAALAAEGVDAYTLAAAASDATPRFRVYAGAYINAGEAEAMRMLLGGVGLEDAPLVERRGTRPE